MLVYDFREERQGFKSRNASRNACSSGARLRHQRGAPEFGRLWCDREPGVTPSGGGPVPFGRQSTVEKAMKPGTADPGDHPGSGAVYGLIRLPGMWTARADGPTPSPRRRLSFHEARQEAYARSLPLAFVALTALVLSMAAVVVQQATSGTLSDGAGGSRMGVHRVRSMRCSMSRSYCSSFPSSSCHQPGDELGALPLWWRSRRHRR